MTDDNSNAVDIDDLDAFENEFFNKPKAEPEVKVEEEVPEEVEQVEENEDDPLANENEADEDEAPEPAPKKRNKTQERIEQLVAEARQAERLAAEREKELVSTRQELERLRVGKEEPTKEVPLKELLSPNGPQPDALDDKGEPLYPLGEFDKQFIADLTRFTINEQMKERDKEQKEQELKKEIEEAQNIIKDTWATNLERAEEELPDLRDKLATMQEAFTGIDPAYGEYLAGTIMSCEYGPEIMYYLSQNIGAAQKIVASGPAAATLAIGRLEAQFMRSAPTEEQEVAKSNKRVSGAPTPPTERSRGTHGRFGVRADTDDLNAFEKEFYKKR